jgi:hypothetical protein
MLILLGIAYTATNCDIFRPNICTREYDPVCGIRADGSRATYSNSCVACSATQNPLVSAWTPGVCTTPARPIKNATSAVGSAIITAIQNPITKVIRTGVASRRVIR